MSEYKEVQIGPKTMGIPVEWDVRKLGDCAEYLNGYPFKPSQWSTEGLPIIRIQNLTGSSNEINHYNGGDLKDRYVVNKGDLLISWSATLGVYIWDGEKAALNQHIFKVRTNGSIDKKFFYFALDQNIEVLKRKIHGSTMKHITKGTFESTLLPLPPLPEQRRIAEILSTVDDAIRKTDEVIEKAERLKKGLMQDLLTKGIGHTEFKEVQIGPKTVGIPVEWDVKTLGNQDGMCEVVAGGTPSTNNSEYWQGDIPWVTPTDITNNGRIYISDSKRKITKMGLKNSSAKLLPEGSILLTTRATIGEACINTVPMATNQGFKSLVCKENVDNIFLFYMIQYEKDRLASLGGGSTFDEVSKKDVVGFEILCPPTSEQNRIADILSSLDNKMQTERFYKQQLESLKKGLMQDLLTGKVRVN